MKQYWITIENAVQHKTKIASKHYQYSEARKKAIDMIRKKNYAILYSDYQNEEVKMKAVKLFHEVAPDKWSNENEILTIETIATIDIMEQDFCISITNEKYRNSKICCKFKCYHDARKTALEVIKQKNEIYADDVLAFHAKERPVSALKEIAPDVWSNEKETIAIKTLNV